MRRCSKLLACAGLADAPVAVPIGVEEQAVRKTGINAAITMADNLTGCLVRRAFIEVLMCGLEPAPQGVQWAMPGNCAGRHSRWHSCWRCVGVVLALLRNTSVLPGTRANLRYWFSIVHGAAIRHYRLRWTCFRMQCRFCCDRIDQRWTICTGWLCQTLFFI